MIIDCNGRLREEREAVVSVYDHGFLYGMGLFETFRTYEGKPFLLDWHLERLHAGCKELDFQYHIEPKELERRISQLLQANGLTDAYFRLTVTAGVEALGLPSAAYGEPSDLIYIKPLPQAEPELYIRGKPLQLLRLRRSTPEGTVRHKSLHYMNNILAKKEMRAYPWAGAAEGLFLDAQECICEGMVSNVFFVREDAIYTPAVDTGLLPGITRRFVIEAASSMGYKVVQGHFGWGMLMEADEAFITNSIQEIVPVTKLYDPDGHAAVLADGNAGLVTKTLLAAYRASAAGEEGSLCFKSREAGK